MQTILVTGKQIARLLTIVTIVGSAAQACATGGIAFIRGGNVWRSDATGQDVTRLTTSGDCSSPSWSRDGRLLVYVRGSGQRDRSLWVYEIGSGTAHRVTKTQSGYKCPRWSPDGKWVACLDQNVPQHTEGPPPVRVLKIDARTRQSVVLINQATGATGIAWSPDSSKLAYAYTPEECLASVSIISASSGKTVRERLSTVGRNDTFDVGIHSLNWLPSGQISFCYYMSDGERSTGGIREVAPNGDYTTILQNDALGSMSVGAGGFCVAGSRSCLWLLRNGELSKLVDDARDVSCY
jgi:Tol biopolymer transport system component